MVSPIVAATYPMDKLGDGKAQALNSLMAQLAGTIFIQFIDCLVYSAFISVIIGMLGGTVNIATLVILWIMLKFMKQARDIFTEIFGIFKAKGADKGNSGIVMLSAAAGLASSFMGGKSGGKATDYKNKKKLPDMKDKDYGAANSSAKPAQSQAPSTKQGAGNGQNPQKPAQKPQPQQKPTTVQGEQNGTKQAPQAGNTQKQTQNGQAGGTEQTVNLQVEAPQPQQATQERQRHEPTGRQRAMEVAGAFGKEALKWSIASGFGLTVAAMQLAKGEDAFKETIGTTIAAKYITDKFVGRDARRGRQLKSNQKAFARQYYDLLDSPEHNYDEAKMRELTSSILKMDKDDIESTFTDKQEKMYAYSVKDMEESFDNLGYDKPDKEVLNTIYDIEDGDIRPYRKMTFGGAVGRINTTDPIIVDPPEPDMSSSPDPVSNPSPRPSGGNGGGSQSPTPPPSETNRSNSGRRTNTNPPPSGTNRSNNGRRTNTNPPPNRTNKGGNGKKPGANQQPGRKK